jgi:glucoamylase
MAAAEQLYKAGYTWDKAGEVNITETSLGFWRDLVGEKAEVGTYKKGSGEYEEMMRRVRDYADGL